MIDNAMQLMTLDQNMTGFLWKLAIAVLHYDLVVAIVFLRDEGDGSRICYIELIL